MSTLKVGDIKHESFTGTTQLKLDSAGNVGIGTTSPSGASGKVLEIEKLEVQHLKLMAQNVCV